MKYILALYVGFMSGIVAAVVALYFNPLTSREVPEIESAIELAYRLSPDAMVAATNNGALPLAVTPRETPELWEAAISSSALNVFVMEDGEANPVAVATRLSKLSDETNLVTVGVLLSDDWLITFPGRGSIFVTARNNVWPLIRHTLVDVDYLRRAWRGPSTYSPTVGPARSGYALVKGLGGDFAGLVGMAEDRFGVTSYATGRRLDGSVNGELRISFEPASDENDR